MEGIKMEKPMIRIHNSTSDKVIDREMTDEEFEISESRQAQYDLQKAEAETKAAQRQVILDKLGLTSDEAKLLIG